MNFRILKFNYFFKEYFSLSRRFIHLTNERNKILEAIYIQEGENVSEDFKRYIQDKRIIYNSFIEGKIVRFNHHDERKIIEKINENKKITSEDKLIQALPAFLAKEMDSYSKKIFTKKSSKNTSETTMPVGNFTTNVGENFPFTRTDEYIHEEPIEERVSLKEPIIDWNPPETSIKDEIKKRMDKYNKGTLERQVHYNPRDLHCEGKGFDYLMTHLDREETVQDLLGEVSTKYGTPNSNIEMSNVPCGGCGAILHCQDASLPGYVPSQRFIGLTKRQLNATICQRCHYLKAYNTALDVKVAPNDYLKSLTPIKNDRALAIVIVDLLDMPVSIWPGLIDILGTRRPVIIVGNKVDLIPADGPGHLDNVMDALKYSIEESDLGQTNIVDMCLVAAANGFGVEDLIDSIHKNWGNKGNIYLLGSTNAGKSTLFNALLGSDLCQSKAVDLIMRATTSPWPGTTLNMLKFPTLSPTGSRLFERKSRLHYQKKTLEALQKTLPKEVNFTKDASIATLSGYVTHTFNRPAMHNEVKDPFAVSVDKIPPSQVSLPNRGINPDNHNFSHCKWVYDTPGAVNDNQILNILTHNEIMKLLSKTLIIPRSYSLLKGQSLLIGGVARLDFLYSEEKIAIICIQRDTHHSRPNG